MGVSTDAILCFGFPVGDDENRPKFLKEYEEFHDLIRADAGIGEWNEAMPEAAYDAYWRRCRDAEKACPVDLVLHCTYEFSMYILIVRGCEITAERGRPVDIDIAKLTPSADQIAEMKLWCAAHDVEFSQPRLILCSMYGW